MLTLDKPENIERLAKSNICCYFAALFLNLRKRAMQPHGVMCRRQGRCVAFTAGECVPQFVGESRCVQQPMCVAPKVTASLAKGTDSTAKNWFPGRIPPPRVFAGEAFSNVTLPNTRRPAGTAGGDNETPGATPSSTLAALQTRQPVVGLPISRRSCR